MLLPLQSTSRRGWRLFSDRKSRQPWPQGWPFLLVAALCTSLLLAACGNDAPTQAPPSPTPLPSYQQENNTSLLFSMNMPYGWVRNVVDANTVVYTNPNDPNIGIGVVSKQIGKLTSDSQRLAQERMDTLKAQFPSMQIDPSGGGTLTLVDTTLNVARMAYTNASNVDVVQYAVEANNVKAERAYVLFGVTTIKDADTNRGLFLNCFKSFMSTAQPNLNQTTDSGVADPTVIAANKGGFVRPTGGRDEQGQYLRLVDWDSPPLNANLKLPVISGLFPYDYSWRLRPFPQSDKPGLYLESNVVDKTTSEATMLFGVYKDAFSTTSPTTDDWNKFYTPILNLLQVQNLKSYGPSVSVEGVALAGQLYRTKYTARSATGDVTSRGIILFSRSGTNGIVSLLSLSQYASVKQALLDNLDADFQEMVSSFSVKF
ncbi:MAG: hypothetical protein J0I20_26125 [Chloroflexi bacterium]|nr:hypothetical protein [Chloroflexota bacterium]OJW06469.1 MAG: hypothetical protein BGO39_00170 [Chloroflexi bacterium 54-19]